MCPLPTPVTHRILSRSFPVYRTFSRGIKSNLRLDISGPCASCNLCIGRTRGICRAAVDLGESRPSLVPSFLNDQKILEQTGESFIPWHTMLPSLSCEQVLDQHISIAIPTPPTQIPI